MVCYNINVSHVLRFSPDVHVKARLEIYAGTKTLSGVQKRRRVISHVVDEIGLFKLRKLKCVDSSFEQTGGMIQYGSHKPTLNEIINE